jgi:hypothetical protein
MDMTYGKPTAVTETKNGKPPSGCSVYELVPEEDQGEPSIFLSHTWGHPVEDFLTLADTYFEVHGEDLVVWLDVISVNQVRQGADTLSAALLTLIHLQHMTKTKLNEATKLPETKDELVWWKSDDVKLDDSGERPCFAFAAPL